VRLTTNRSDGRYVSYAAGDLGNPLIYVPAHWSGRVYLPPSLQGTVSQFFRDRTYDWSGSFFPFAPTETDTLGVTIWLGTGTNIQPGEVTFTLVSWGNAIVNFFPERCDGMVYGLSGNTGLLLSLFTDIPIK